MTNKHVDAGMHEHVSVPYFEMHTNRSSKPKPDPPSCPQCPVSSQVRPLFDADIVKRVLLS